MSKVENGSARRTTEPSPAEIDAILHEAISPYLGAGGKVWTCGDWAVHYEPQLDGGGTYLARPFVDYLRRNGRPHYPRCFEWCSGPGFIGVALLRAGLIGELVLADKNPAVKPCVERTRRANALSITYYESDNFRKIPEHERFDLVVANPPNYCRLNPAHPCYETLRDDPRPNDPGWRIHRDFYATVGEHLSPGAELFISEVEPEQHEVFIPGISRSIAYDLRADEPLATFDGMIAAGGLELLSMEPYFEIGGVTFTMLRSRLARASHYG